MTSQGRRGDFYRSLILGLFPQAVQQELVGADFAAVLEQAFDETSEERAPSLGRYVTATGLLACGRAEMVEVLLDNVPDPVEARDVSGKMPYLGTNALRALLPLPPELKGEGGWCSYPDLAGIRHWWNESAEALRWDVELDRFVLEHVHH